MSKQLKELLETKDGTERMIQECIDVVANSKGVVIFGAGVGGSKLYDLLVKKELDYKVIAFSDNNHLKFNKSYISDKLFIISPAKLVAQCGKDCSVLIASSAYDSIKRQLLSYGYSEKNIHLFNFAFMDLDNSDKDFIWAHIDDFERAYARMQDEKSRQIFVDILNYKITKRGEYLFHMQKYVDDEKRQYFPEGLFEFKENEVFLDIGAYTGDTLEAFDSIYNSKWKKYLGFEADISIFLELQSYVERHERKEQIKIYNLAAWSNETTLYFSGNAGSSSMGEEETKGKTAIKADMLDNILQNEQVTFIKMDIEGAEFNAISGMKNLIKQNNPILAVCVYHCRDDFYVLTDLIENICPSQYVFYFRQYRFTPTETVCYAIPKNRLFNVNVD